MEDRSCDVVVIGSGAGGAVAAYRVLEAGFKVILVEAGGQYTKEQFTTAFWTTMKSLFWENGFQYSYGKPMLPFLQGRAVGGTTVINSAICWDLPKDIHEEWMKNEAFSLSYDEIDQEQQKIRQESNVKYVEPEIMGGNNNAMARGAERLGWEGRVIQRNERDCKGSGRCLLGCPNGAKLSTDLTYVPWGIEKGMELIANCEAERVLVEKGRVVGIIANKLDVKARGRLFIPKRGKRFKIKAKCVIVAGGVIQSPLILQRSRIPDPHRLIGENLMAHPGISMVGCYDEKINIWSGATQGYEVTQFRQRGIKLESLGVAPSLFGVRLPGASKRLALFYEKRAHMTLWAAATRAECKGSVKIRRFITPIRYPLLKTDVERFLLAIRILGKLMFAAGAREVYPGIVGRPEVVRSYDELHAMTHDPIRGIQIHPIATHLFGTCRASDDPQRGVVNGNFESHHIKGLYVADGSVFPTNTGVNPQLSIMAMGGIAGRRVAESL